MFKNPEEIIGNAQKMFVEAKTNMLKAQEKMIKKNSVREDAPDIREKQEIFVIPNVRTKTEARATETLAQNIKEKTFINLNNVKRHKNKIKRIRKRKD